MLPQLVSLLLITILSQHQVYAGWWPFGDLGRTGLFSKWSQRPQQGLGFQRPAFAQQQPQHSAFVQQQPQRSAFARQQPQRPAFIQQQAQQPKPTQSPWWPVYGSGFPAFGREMPFPVQHFGDGGNTNTHVIKQSSGQNLLPQAFNGSQQWNPSNSDQQWQIVREAVSNGSAPGNQNYVRQSVYSTGDSDPDMIRKVLPQVQSLSNRFGIPIDIEEPQWAVIQEHTMVSKATPTQPPKVHYIWNDRGAPFTAPVKPNVEAIVPVSPVPYSAHERPIVSRRSNRTPFVDVRLVPIEVEDAAVPLTVIPVDQSYPRPVSVDFRSNGRSQ